MLANNVGPDQTPHVASDLGLHCLPMTLLRVSWQEWVKMPYYEFLTLYKLQYSYRENSHTLKVNKYAFRGDNCFHFIFLKQI